MECSSQLKGAFGVSPSAQSPERKQNPEASEGKGRGGEGLWPTRDKAGMRVGWGGGAWKAGQPLKAGEQESRWWETCEDL